MINKKVRSLISLQLYEIPFLTVSLTFRVTSSAILFVEVSVMQFNGMTTSKHKLLDPWTYICKNATSSSKHTNVAKTLKSTIQK